MTDLAEAGGAPRLSFQPGRLWSLLEMIELPISDVVDANSELAMLGQMFEMLQSFTGSKTSMAPDAYIQNLARMLAAAAKIAEVSKEAELDAAQASADRLCAMLEDMRRRHLRSGMLDVKKDEADELHRLVVHTRVCFTDQLEARFGLMLTAAEVRLYAPKDKKPLFGDLVAMRFNDARHDIEEAGKCLALNRNTATVFHLMRVMELGVRELAASLAIAAGSPITVHKPNGEFLEWGGLLSNIKKQGIDKLTKPDEVRAWSEIHALLYTVKEAWRNPTMHPASKYTDAEASEIFNAVRSLTRKLATLV